MKTQKKTMKKQTDQYITPEMVAELMAQLQVSGLEPSDILAYQMSLLQGTFTMELYHEIQEKLDKRLSEQEKTIQKLQEEVENLEAQQRELDQKVIDLAPEAADEIQKIQEGYLITKTNEIEGQIKSSESEQVKALRSKIKQSHE